MKRLRRFENMFFVSGLNPEEAPFIIERLRGTPLRVRELTRDLSKEQLTAKPNDEWSVLEHLDHLAASDREFSERIGQYLKRSDVIDPNGLDNGPAMSGAAPGTVALSDLQAAFDTSRRELISLVENLDEATYAHAIYFPFLNREVSLVDKLFFIAQHDDSHVAWLWRLSQGLVG